MSNKRNHIAICGAGIAGIATAWTLAKKYNQKDIVLIDKLQPMSLTTSKSGENFRNYWPQACMTDLCDSSIQIMDELATSTSSPFELHRSGYDFVSESPGHEIFPLSDDTQAFEKVTQSETIRTEHDYLSESIKQIYRFKQAGAFDVHSLGTLMLSEARKAGVQLCTAEIEHIEQNEQGYKIDLIGAANDNEIRLADKVILTPGPFINRLLAMLNIELPIKSILQRKFVIPDLLNIIPRDMPFTIFADSQYLDWTAEEAALIKEDSQYDWLLEEFPPGLHIKPEGKDQIKLGWAYNRSAESPQWYPKDGVDFPNVTLKGASRFIPALKPYVENPPTPLVQFSGYYTRTPENLPLIGPLPMDGLFTVSALSGYGTMTACGAANICAQYLLGETLPEYAKYFHPARYQDSALIAEINSSGGDGQL